MHSSNWLKFLVAGIAIGVAVRRSGNTVRNGKPQEPVNTRISVPELRTFTDVVRPLQSTSNDVLLRRAQWATIVSAIAAVIAIVFSASYASATNAEQRRAADAQIDSTLVSMLRDHRKFIVDCADRCPKATLRDDAFNVADAIVSLRGNDGSWVNAAAKLIGEYGDIVDGADCNPYSSVFRQFLNDLTRREICHLAAYAVN